MKILAYLFVFMFVSASLVSCGASGSSCVSGETYIIKNMRFDNQEIVLSNEFKEDLENIQ